MSHSHELKIALLKSVVEKMTADGYISVAASHLWFDNCEIDEIDPYNVFLTVDSVTKKDALSVHYKDILSDCFSKELGYPVDIVIEVKEKEEEKKREDYDSLKTESAVVGKDDYYRKNDVYTFDNYVVGSSNSLAYNAARSVSKKPSDEFNPLYIYGPSGIGKTHLLYAIANEISKNHPEKTIIYVKGEGFVSSLIGSIKEGTMNVFRNKYRNADVLLVDDIQVIEGKKSTQEEFFYTFDALYEKHKQIILSSDCAPSDLAVLVDRLKGRFSMGLVTDIQAPDFELRLAIMRKKAENVGLIISDEMLEYLADKLHSNIREIEGVIKKLSALSFFTKQSITFKDVEKTAFEFIKNELSDDEKINIIIEKTAFSYNISINDILGKSREKDIKDARNLAMYLIKNQTGKTLSDIAVMFDRKHPTVYSNIEAVKKRIEEDPYLPRKIEEILKEIRN